MRSSSSSSSGSIFRDRTAYPEEFHHSPVRSLQALYFQVSLTQHPGLACQRLLSPHRLRRRRYQRSRPRRPSGWRKRKGHRNRFTGSCLGLPTYLSSIPDITAKLIDFCYTPIQSLVCLQLSAQSPQALTNVPSVCRIVSFNISG
jgi:hypothetical protein